MSTLGLDADEFRALESLRQRLATLTANLKSLQDTILRSNPLPSPSSLQASARIAQQNLSSLQNLLADRQDLFARLAVHPSTNFPGREHEMILQSLLRKKLEQDVETWVEECRETAVRAGVDVNKAGKVTKQRRGEEDEEDEDEEEDEEGYRPEDEDDVGGDPLTDLWADVRDALTARITEFVEGESQDVYTIEERERGVDKVRTGLKRDLEEEEEDSEDEEEEGGEKEDADVVMLGTGGPPAKQQPPTQNQSQVPSVEPELVLWFGVRGDFSLPGNIETESTRKAKAGAGRRGGPGR